MTYIKLKILYIYISLTLNWKYYTYNYLTLQNWTLRSTRTGCKRWRHTKHNWRPVLIITIILQSQKRLLIDRNGLQLACISSQICNQYIFNCFNFLEIIIIMWTGSWNNDLRLIIIIGCNNYYIYSYIYVDLIWLLTWNQA